MSIAITEEQRAVQQSISDATARADTVGAVRAMESGVSASWRRLWPDLADIGLFSIALPEDVGGAGCGLDDQCAALEQAAAALVPGPVPSTVLAGILLARHGNAVAAKELLPRLVDGTATAAVALGAGDLTAADLVVSGEAGGVLGAGDTAHLLLAANGPGGELWFLLDPGQPGVTVTGLGGADFSRAVGRVRLDRVVVPAERVLTGLSLGAVTELAATLLAAEAAGVAGWCVRTAAQYAKVREQFGRSIGSFQAVKHLCAEMLCRAEVAGAVAWDAARAFDDAPDEHPLAAATAAAVALDAAVDNAKDCVQVLGGIGFTWEHDAHLYLRRAIALRELLGGSHRWRRRAAELAMAGARRRLTIDVGGASNAERRAVRAFAEQVAALPAAERRARLAASGYLAPHWPAPYGLAASPRTQLMIDEELRRAGVSRPDLVIGAWAVPTIIQYGNEIQRERFVLPTLRGELEWCQLFSEPGAGSDLASLRTRAERAEGGWRLTGQKVWTSRAREADWAICLARTDPSAPKHKGITYFLVDMRAPGIEVRPLREITGEARFNEVFLDRVFVPDDCVVGAVNDGWRLARTTLANERVAIGGGSSLGEAVEQLLDRVTDADPVTLERLGGLVARGHAVSLVDYRATLRRLDGQDPGSESSVRKLIGVRHRQDVAEVAMDLFGANGELLHEFLLTRCLSIAGGTTQVLLNVIAERLLGLPRD